MHCFAVLLFLIIGWEGKKPNIHVNFHVKVCTCTLESQQKQPGLNINKFIKTRLSHLIFLSCTCMCIKVITIMSMVAEKYEQFEQIICNSKLYNT